MSGVEGVEALPTPLQVIPAVLEEWGAGGLANALDEALKGCQPLPAQQDVREATIVAGLAIYRLLDLVGLRATDGAVEGYSRRLSEVYRLVPCREVHVPVGGGCE